MITGEKLYLVTYGEYSDFRIVAMLIGPDRNLAALWDSFDRKLGSREIEAAIQVLYPYTPGGDPHAEDRLELSNKLYNKAYENLGLPVAEEHAKFQKSNRFLLWLDKVYALREVKFEELNVGYE